MMTDKEQDRLKTLVLALHQAAFDGQKTTLARIHWSHLARAADEIERLAESLKASHGYSDECEEKIKFLNNQIDAMLASPALAQSNAEPVAWEYKTADGWQRISLENYKILMGSSFELRPVFDPAPPRPDVSAGLIEAAKIAEEWDSGWGEDRNTKVAHQTASEIAEAIRARAADGSGK